MKIITLIEQLRHACSIALGDLISLGMPEGTSTHKALEGAITAAVTDQHKGDADLTPPPDVEINPSIKVGDLLYTVGINSLQVFSARVNGIYSESYQGAPFTIELSHDRPISGFRKRSYQSYEVGIHIHRSASEALHAFVRQAQQRRAAAEQIRDTADAEIEWALTTAAKLQDSP